MDYRTHTYLVSTAHSHYRPSEFIVPVEIEAASPAEAARKRFDLLAEPEKCSALLVTREDGSDNPRLFTVKRKCEWVLS